MKTIKFTQQVEVIETYETEYSEADFEYDKNLYKIENLTYDELCDIFENNKEVFISVTESHFDPELDRWVDGPHMVDTIEFFSFIMDDQAYNMGPIDCEAIEIVDRQIQIEDDFPADSLYTC